MSSPPTHPTYYNVLLYGETGAGKSTTINALAHYLRYPDYDLLPIHTSGQSAVTPLCLPTIYSIDDDHGCDGTVNRWPLQKSVVDEACHQSATVAAAARPCTATWAPQSYEFPLQTDRCNAALRVIDTPGMGGGDLAADDDRHLDAILTHLRSLTPPVLHAVCLVTPMTTARATVGGQRSLDRLLTRLLPRPHCCQASLLFCFTHARNSLFGPGDGQSVVRSMLATAERTLGTGHVALAAGANCFYLDHEAFRYLTSGRSRFPVTTTAADHHRRFQDSWNRSAGQAAAMIERIGGQCVPFPVQILMELRRLQAMVPRLAEPARALVEELRGEGEPTNGRNRNSEVASVVPTNMGSLLLELRLVHRFTVAVLRYLVVHLNMNCHALIRPYLSLFAEDGTPVEVRSKETAIHSQNGLMKPKRMKLQHLTDDVDDHLHHNHQSSSSSSSTSQRKLTRVIDHLRGDDHPHHHGHLEEQLRTLEYSLFTELNYSRAALAEIIGPPPGPWKLTADLMSRSIQPSVQSKPLISESPTKSQSPRQPQPVRAIITLQVQFFQCVPAAVQPDAVATRPKRTNASIVAGAGEPTNHHHHPSATNVAPQSLPLPPPSATTASGMSQTKPSTILGDPATVHQQQQQQPKQFLASPTTTSHSAATSTGAFRLPKPTSANGGVVASNRASEPECRPLIADHRRPGGSKRSEASDADVNHLTASPTKTVKKGPKDQKGGSWWKVWKNKHRKRDGAESKRGRNQNGGQAEVATNSSGGSARLETPVVHQSTTTTWFADPGQRLDGGVGGGRRSEAGRNTTASPVVNTGQLPRSARLEEHSRQKDCCGCWGGKL